MGDEKWFGKSKQGECAYRDTDQAKTLFFTQSKKANPQKVLSAGTT